MTRQRFKSARVWVRQYPKDSRIVVTATQITKSPYITVFGVKMKVTLQEARQLSLFAGIEWE